MTTNTHAYPFAGMPVIEKCHYHDGGLRVNVWDDEGPVATLSCNVISDIDPTYQFVLNHDVGMKLLHWMHQSGRFLIDFDRLVSYGYVQGQPVVTLVEANSDD